MRSRDQDTGPRRPTERAVPDYRRHPPGAGDLRRHGGELAVFVVLGESEQSISDSSQESVAPGSTSTSYQDTTRFTNGPGTYALGAISQDGEYTYEVQDCGIPPGVQGNLL